MDPTNVAGAASYCAAARDHPWHGPYHDGEYGFPVREDNLLFERLVLEMNQAGLSWLTILKKRESFRNAYHGFRVERVAAYGEQDLARLLADPGVVRNRLKIEAAVHNAGAIRALARTHESFTGWLDAHHPQSVRAWTQLFKKTFRFTGGEITREFLVSTGYLPGAHDRSCPVYASVLATRPPWSRSLGDGVG